ncbi:MAG: FAD-dependent oxidoreductase [Synechococcaceae cyanobacterium]|nr:FAD-dependent oxidoreductase [Synechococcaceae cyanobacterium]
MLPLLGGCGAREPGRAVRALRPCRSQGQRHFRVLVFGDEPAGVMTALELRRRLRDGSGRPPPIALVTDADIRRGLGGTIARAGLAYLDRNQVPADLWATVGPFAPSSELFARFLRISGAAEIAVDPRRLSSRFHAALAQAGITVLPEAGSRGAVLEGRRLCLLSSDRWGRLGADLFIDASLGGRLAQLAGVPFQPGLGSGPMATQTLALGWIFELEGLRLEDLHRLEASLSRRLLDRHDLQAQQWLRHWPQYRHDRRRLLHDLLDAGGHPRLAWSATADSADQRSPALAIAVHGEEGGDPFGPHWRYRFDKANVAILPGRLSLNALLLANDPGRNRQLLAHQGSPPPGSAELAARLTHFFRRHGARRVRWMPELYIRSADQIAHPLQALSAARMAQGGVDPSEALGTFTYPLDFRGLISDRLPRARPTFNFGYRHTLPRERDNLAVLGPAAGYGGLGAGAGRIIELNISVGQGLAIASALALEQGVPLAVVRPDRVAQVMSPGYAPYGRPSRRTALQLLLRRVEALLEPLSAREDQLLRRLRAPAD